MIRYLLIFWAGLLIPLTGFAEDIRPNILFAFADDWGKYASTYAKAVGSPLQFSGQLSIIIAQTFRGD